MLEIGTEVELMFDIRRFGRTRIEAGARGEIRMIRMIGMAGQAVTGYTVYFEDGQRFTVYPMWVAPLAAMEDETQGCTPATQPIIRVNEVDSARRLLERVAEQFFWMDDAFHMKSGSAAIPLRPDGDVGVVLRDICAFLGR